MLMLHLQVLGVTADASGWVRAATSKLDSITLGDPSGSGMNGVVQGLWVLPAAVRLDAVPAPAGAAVADVLANLTATSTLAPAISLVSVTQSPVVGAVVSITMSAAGQQPMQLRLTFYGAAPM